MALPLDSHQAELLDLLAAAIAKLGLRRVPLVEPTPAFFPDRYQPTLPGAGRLLHRLLGFAGVKEELELVDGRKPLVAFIEGVFEVTRPVVSFIATEGGRAVFQVDALGPGDLTAAAMCHEVARASLGAGANEELAAAATIVHGFGLITLPAATSMRRSSVLAGEQVISRQRLMLTGALPPGDLAFLLAAWLIARGASDAAPLERHLDEKQAANVKEWMAALGPSRRELCERLRLPWTDERALATVPKVPEPSAGQLAAWDRAEEAHLRPNQGRRVMRRWHRKTVEGLVLGGIAGVIAMFVCLAQERWWPAAASLAIGLLVGRFIGRRRREYRCGGCGLALRRHEQACPKCGARFDGDEAAITRIADMEDAPEDDELTRQALAAAPLDDDDEAA